MNAMKCDRCGKYVDGDDTPMIRGWKSETAHRLGNHTIKMDLCNECYEALTEFLSNKEDQTDDENSISIKGDSNND